MWVGENLTRLYGLVLKSNNFFGPVPLQLCHLVNLQILDLSMNNLNGTIPPCVNNLTDMVHGRLSESFTHRYSMVEESGLIMTGTYFDYVMMESQGKERELTSTLRLLISIDLSSNNLIGQIANELTNHHELLVLNLSKNALHGEIPRKIGDLKKLLTLELSKNNFFGEIPPSMSQIASLTCQINPEVVPIKSCKRGQEMIRKCQQFGIKRIFHHRICFLERFNDTKVEGTLNMSPLKLLELKSIVEYQSKFDDKSDAFPQMLLEERFKCVSCECHIVSHTRFEMNRSAFISLWKHLFTTSPLPLAAVTAPNWLPIEVARIVVFGDDKRVILRSLDLSQNSFSMQIPADIGKLSNIKRLILGDDQLTGPIPSSMCNMTKLESLWLTRNKLAGEIPTWLFEIKTLKPLFIGGKKII
ncbi:hypothetical protein OSB04_011211 [Centaurea solstitialis]|uniref:Uncharacterized protein n=1 Tax=Centaurea solstitialis TaxID=347529 RepID=A0AA38WCP9_9ASTR|nr:hypothetical protein OSB04_011211 [Centaurea solstitialis]